MPGNQAATLAQLWFPGQASAVGQVRRFVASVVGEDFPALDDLLVLVSEVAANAVKHTASGDGGAFEIVVWVRARSVWRWATREAGPNPAWPTTAYRRMP